MRYLPHTPATRAAMLHSMGVADINSFYAAIPASLRLQTPLNLPPAQTERDIEQHMRQLAAKNLSAEDTPFFLGAGCYYHHVPATVDHLVQRGEFLTAYTPYQPEVSQGTLAAMFEFQTYIAAITGQEIANASLYDGATACAEAALMAMRLSKKNSVAVCPELHPHYRAVLHTYIHAQGGTVVDISADDNVAQTLNALGDVACLVWQNPTFFGNISATDFYTSIQEQTGVLLVCVVSEIVSLGMLPPPEKADIVCGEAQSLGNSMNFGGPHVGFLATKQAYVRQMPGRLAGQTTDSDGKTGYVLTLNTREQHIRREKATSNICTNQGLCALAFTIHTSLLGEEGFKLLAQHNHQKACMLADALSNIPNVTIQNTTFFNEFVVRLPKSAHMVVEKLAEQGIIAGLAVGEFQLLVAATEMTEPHHIQRFVQNLQQLLATQ